MEEVQTNFMGYKAMCHCRPIIIREHNLRNPKIVQSEKHIDQTRFHETILDLGTLEESYEQIFGESIATYNAKQKRKERRIKNYLETILNDKRQGKHKNLKADGSRKPAYEMIIQLGNRDNRPEDEKVIPVLKDFTTFLTKKYPNIRPIGIYLHDDEFSVDEETGKKIYSPAHIHFDFVYIAHLGKSLKTGMELQSSLSGALAEMGFVTSKGKGTAQMQFEESCRHDLQDFAEERGIIIDRTLGEKHSHKEKPVYQQMKENQKKEQQLNQREKDVVKTESELNSNINSYNDAANYLNTEIQKNNKKSLELRQKERLQKVKDFEQERREQDLNSKEMNVKYRETMAEAREKNLEFYESQKEKKEQELLDREKIIAIGEAPLLEKQKKLEKKEEEVNSKFSEAEGKLNEADTKLKKAESIQSQTEELKKDLEQKQKVFELQKEKVNYYQSVYHEVEEKNLEIENEEKRFHSDPGWRFSERIERFVKNVKKIVTGLVVELNTYKTAFKSFWQKRSDDFRKLADSMDKNHCLYFADYNAKSLNGELDFQIEEKRLLQQKKEERRRFNNSGMSW